MRLALLAYVVILLSPRSGLLLAQSDLYDPDVIQELRLYFDEPNWSDLLDTLFIAGNNDRLIGSLYINGTLLPDVGVRYKGFSSYSSARVKNPFNIKLNHINTDQNYQEYDKIKLSNVIQDPSFVREVLSYEIARDYMPASKANFANLYVNDTLIGLYSNVEAVNKEFTQLHFDERNAVMFKCNPDQVNLSGENSNLSDTPGSDSTQYYSLYSLESDYGWSELLNLIDILNNHPDSIDQVLNIDRALWMHAFNNVLINFDSYVGYAQNYYLFQDRNELWNTIPWDLNMSFGSFRLSDASTFFAGFSIAQAKVYDPLSQLNNFLVHPRPLFKQLLSNPTYKRMYLAHMRTIVQEHLNNQYYYQRATDLQNSIASSVVADTNKFYSNAMFLQNLDSTVSDVIDYPGIRDLMEARSIYLSSYDGFTGQPTVSAALYQPSIFGAGDLISIQMNINAADSAFLAYRSDEDDAFEYAALFDDGMHQDGSANDGLFAADILVEANYVEYYIYAENDSAGTFSPSRAAYEYHEILVPVHSEGIVINELMADNDFYGTDGEGESDDWIELVNTGTQAISTAGLYLSDDDTQILKWALPIRILDPGEFMIVWADEQPTQGSRHANFKLNSSGEKVFLSYQDSSIVNTVNFPVQYPISSYGRYPNGTGSFKELLPTWNAPNKLATDPSFSNYIHIYPNPTAGNVNLIVREDQPFTVQVYTIEGKQMSTAILHRTKELITISTRSLTPGIYSLEIRTQDNTSHSRFILSE